MLLTSEGQLQQSDATQTEYQFGRTESQNQQVSPAFKLALTRSGRVGSSDSSRVVKFVLQGCECVRFESGFRKVALITDGTLRRTRESGRSYPHLNVANQRHVIASDFAMEPRPNFNFYLSNYDYIGNSQHLCSNSC